MSNIPSKNATNSSRDYAEIGAAFLIVLGVLFALGQLPSGPRLLSGDSASGRSPTLRRRSRNGWLPRTPQEAECAERTCSGVS